MNPSGFSLIQTFQHRFSACLRVAGRLAMALTIYTCALAKADARDANFASKTIGVAVLTKGEVDSKGPFFILQGTDGKTYRLRFGPKIYAEVVARNLLSRISGRVREAMLVKNYPLVLGTGVSVQALARFWAVSAPKLLWTQYFSELKSGGSNASEAAVAFTVKEALLEEVSLFDELDSEKPSQAESIVSLGSAWLQCVSPTDLRYCFGNTEEASSPNLFVPEMAMVKDPMKSSESFGTVREFLRLTAAAGLDREENLVGSFVDAGFPSGLSILYARKLLSRRAGIAKLVGLKVAPNVSWTLVNDPPYIVNGEFHLNYEMFQAELTRETLDELFQKVAGRAVGQIDILAREILATLPYMGGEVAHIGKMSISPGLLIRIKRSIDVNPNPQSTDATYIVRDDLEFLVTLGVGLDANAGPTNLWGSVSPAGYARRYTHTFYAPSKASAKSKYWSISKDLIFNSDLRSLKRGETLMIQSGYVAAAVVGGNIRGYIVRPAVYLMGTVEYLNSIQVGHTLDDQWLVVGANETRETIAAKFFWRVYNRYLRIPMADWHRIHGNETLRAFKLPLKVAAPSLSDSFEESTLANAFRHAVQTYNLDGLAKLLPAQMTNVNYSASGTYLNTYIFDRRAHASNATVRVSSENAGGIASDRTKRYFSIAKSSRRAGNRFTGAHISSGCDGVAALQFQDEQKRVYQDGVITIRCVLSNASADRASLTKDVAWALAAANLPTESVHSLLPEAKEVRGGSDVVLTIQLPVQPLKSLLFEENLDWVDAYFTSVNQKFAVEQSRAGLQASAAEMQRRVLMAAVINSITQGQSPGERLRNLLDLTVPHGSDTQILKLIRGLANASFVKVEVAAESLATTNSEVQSVSAGELIESSLTRYLAEREVQGGKLSSDQH